MVIDDGSQAQSGSVDQGFHQWHFSSAFNHEVQKENCVFGDEPDKHDHAQNRDDVECDTENHERPNRGNDSERHGQQQVDRVAERIELRPEHQVIQENRNENRNRAVKEKVAEERGATGGTAIAKSNLFIQQTFALEVFGDWASSGESVGAFFECDLERGRIGFGVSRDGAWCLPKFKSSEFGEWQVALQRLRVDGQIEQ